MNGLSPVAGSQAVGSLIATIEAVLDAPVNYSAMEHMTDQFHDREEAVSVALDAARSQVGAPTGDAQVVSLVVAVDAVLDAPVNYSAMEHMTEQFHDREEAIRRALDAARETSRG